ncbi:hypothetical protein ACFL5V_03970 [Fibrobacterota bacterium]
MFRSILFIVSACLTAVLIYCTSDSSTGPGSQDPIFNDDITVESIDTAGRSLTLENIVYSCSGDSLVADTNTVILDYYIADSLFLWVRGECGAIVFHGVSTGILGSWTATNFEPVAIPEEARPSQCGSAISSTMFLQLRIGVGLWGILSDSLIQNPRVVAHVSQQSISLNYDADMCWAQFYANLLMIPYANNPDFEITSSVCEQVMIANVSDSLTAQFHSSTGAGVTILTFTQDQTVCMASAPYETGTEIPDCANPDTTDQSLDIQALRQCIDSTGFFDD